MCKCQCIVITFIVIVIIKYLLLLAIILKLKTTYLLRTAILAMDGFFGCMQFLLAVLLEQHEE